MATIIPFYRKRFVYENDAQMVLAVMVGDEGATRYLFYDHYTALLRKNYNKVVGQLPVQFDDLVQELYLYLCENDWGKLKKFDPDKDDFVCWFSTVSFRFFKDCCKKKFYSSTDFSDDIPNYDKRESYFDWENSELMRDLRRVLPFFQPPRDREIIEATIIHDEPIAEVAKRYNLTENNLSTIKRRALARLVATYLSDYKK